jgi:hypothetical protein
MPSIFIEDNPLYHNKVKWVMHIISQYARTSYEYVLVKHQSNISLGSSVGHDIRLDGSFFKKLQNGQTKWKDILPDGPIYKNEHGEDCLLETIFYLVNCIQELNPEPSDLDHYGRFRYKDSLQYHYGIIETNFVGQLIDQLIERYPILTEGKGRPQYPVQIFLSHDIDLLHAGWKVETYLALKDFNWKVLVKVVRDILLRKPFYNNIDQVMALDNASGFKSCFYWLPAYGKDANGIMNADYSLKDLDEMSRKVLESGFECGIHKSSFPTSFAEEMSRLPFKVEHNRYHFLKFQTHKAWKEIEAAGLKTDASLGFAEHIGFRNSYGLPFVPFDMGNDRPYSFVEIPLHMMDVTLFQYMELDKTDIFNKVKSFFNKNEKNCVISVLWHNNELTEYRHLESFQTYKQLFSELGLSKISYKRVDDLFSEYILVSMH